MARPKIAQNTDLPAWLMETQGHFYLRIPERVSLPPKWKHVYALGKDRVTAIRRAQRFHRAIRKHRGATGSRAEFANFRPEIANSQTAAMK